MRDTRVRSLGWEDPLEKEMVTHSSIPAWRIPWTEEPGGLTVCGVAKSQTRLSDFTKPTKLAYWLDLIDLNFMSVGTMPILVTALCFYSSTSVNTP